MYSTDIRADREINGHRIIVLADEAQCASYIVAFWRTACWKLLENNPSIAIALSGGNSPKITLSALSREQGLPWRKMNIFMVDERFVPHDDEASNYGMIRRRLLDHVPVPPQNIYPINTGLPNPVDSAGDYEKEIITHFNLKKNELPRFDIIMLGLGKDGHTASLFPGSPAFSETQKIVQAVFPGGNTHDRITLTLRVLNNARHILMLVLGKSKAAILEKMVKNQNYDIPGSRVHPENGDFLIIADADAAALAMRD